MDKPCSEYTIRERTWRWPFVVCKSGQSQLAHALELARTDDLVIVIGGTHTGPFTVPSGVRLFGIDNPLIYNPKGVGLILADEGHIEISNFAFDCKIGFADHNWVIKHGSAYG